MQCKYHKLILIDNSEYNLFKLSSTINNKKNISFHLINFNNKNDLKRLLSEDKVDIIFHAAAFKHVPLIELNPFSAIKNNFLDTFDFMKFITNFNVKILFSLSIKLLDQLIVWGLQKDYLNLLCVI